MSGLLNSTGAVSGILGTTVGTPAHTETNAANIGSGVLPVGVTGGSGLTALGTVVSGNLSHADIVMPRIKEIDYFHVYSNENTTTSNVTNFNISDSAYLEVTPEHTADIIEFGYDFSCYSGNGYFGWGIERATVTGFGTGQANIWRNGEHTVQELSGHNYMSFGGAVTHTASEFGMAADTTYYCRMFGMTHDSPSNTTFGTKATNSILGGLKLTMKRWSIV